MSEVDIEDDSIHRFIVWRYKYEDKTGQFKRVPIAAYSSRREANKKLKAETKVLLQQQLEGNADSREYVSSDQKLPGHRTRAVELRQFLRKVQSARKR